jgi:hypothetical protein
MSLGKIQVVQIMVSSDHLYGLDQYGQVWFRSLIPRSVSTTINSTPAKKEEEEKKKAAETIWKRVSMRCQPPKELLKIEDAERVKQEPIDAPEDKGEIILIEGDLGTGPLEVEAEPETGPWEIEGSEV